MEFSTELSCFLAFRIRKSAELNPIIISLDCHHDETLKVAKSFGDQIKAIIEV